MKKKIINIFISLTLLIVILPTFLSGCGLKKANNTMNVSLNPSIEFVLDQNNKVMSVTATNDEGNYILANINFVGLDYEKAVEQFISKVKELGYITQNTINNLKVQLSDGSLEEKIKDDVQQFLSGFSVEVKLDVEPSKTIEELRNEVEEYYGKFVESANLKKEELISYINKAHEEVKDFYNNNVKEFYFLAKERALEQIEVSKKAAAEWDGDVTSLIVKGAKAIYDTSAKLVSGLQDALLNTYESLFLKEDSIYMKACEKVVETKKAFLEAAPNGEVDPKITKALDDATTALNNAKDLAFTSLSNATKALDDVLDLLEEQYNKFETYLQDNLQIQINTEINKEEKTFNSDFKVKYKDYIDINLWVSNN